MMVNALKTTILLAAMTALFMGVGFLVGGQTGMMIAFGFAVITNLFAFWNSDKLVLRMQNARPLDRARAPELYGLVERLSARAGIPVPALYLIDAAQPNAFATGRNPQNAAVAVTSGLLRHLNEPEVAAVVAHELAHIRSRDTLIMTVTATLAGAITMLAQFGLFFGGRNSNSPLGPLGAIAVVILAPLAAMLVQMAVSRTREYQADRDGAEIAGDPMALASALEKISGQARRIENPAAHRSPGMAHMFIINPLTGHGADNLFATHPNVANRIAALKAMSREISGAASFVAAPRRAPVPSGRTRDGGWRVPRAGRGRGDGSGTSGPWG